MSPNRTSLELTSDREIVIRRTFRAPPSVVFEAWTKPEFVKRWWAPASRGAAVIECDADVRPGGEYRYVTAVGPGQRFAFFGKYLEIVPPTRLVYTQVFEPYPDAEVVVTVSFEERDGSTLLVAREVYPSKEALEGAMASGMEEGLRETFDQLDALVASARG
ncbi:MAG TPA: SRPBCC family protein [Polyangiaceae bacterium]|nr:SRPBCC family protein [Polyangiaceae bacterium]